MAWCSPPPGFENHHGASDASWCLPPPGFENHHGASDVPWCSPPPGFENDSGAGDAASCSPPPGFENHDASLQCEWYVGDSCGPERMRPTTLAHTGRQAGKLTKRQAGKLTKRQAVALTKRQEEALTKRQAEALTKRQAEARTKRQAEVVTKHPGTEPVKQHNKALGQAQAGCKPRTPNEPPKRGSMKWRTQLCLYWQRDGKCEYGDACNYAHSPDQLRVPEESPLYRAWTCPMFANGCCRYGDACYYRHPPGPPTGPLARQPARQPAHELTQGAAGPGTDRHAGQNHGHACVQNADQACDHAWVGGGGLLQDLVQDHGWDCGSGLGQDWGQDWGQSVDHGFNHSQGCSCGRDQGQGGGYGWTWVAGHGWIWYDSVGTAPQTPHRVPPAPHRVPPAPHRVPLAQLEPTRPMQVTGVVATTTAAGPLHHRGLESTFLKYHP